MSQLIEALRDAVGLIEHLGGNAKMQRAAIDAALAAAEAQPCTCPAADMPFGRCCKAPQVKTTGEWDSARVADYNQGWNDCISAAAPVAAAEAQPAPAKVELVPLEMHNLLTAGPAPWTATRVPSELWHVARAVYGTSSEDDEKRVYRTVQSALWSAAEFAAPVAAAQPESAPVEVPQWQPIETAPDRTPFRANVATPLPSGEFYVEEAWWDYTRRQWWAANVDYSDSHGCAIYPTHWMPLPAAPGEQVAAAPALCACKDRPASACPGEWEPGCDLGNNEAHCVAAPAPQPLTDEQIAAIVREASAGGAIRRDGSTSLRIARAIEAAHGIKGAA